MQRCIELAQNSLDISKPNPAVGCVIVYNKKIIGEGYTSKFGSHHAEVNAINSIEDKSILSKSSLYVSLEPCSHFGKTPPCTDLIIKYKIPKVYIGTSDSNELVAGMGVKKLIESGCQVKIGILEDQCRYINRRFFTFYEKLRPYIILKWAQSYDGFIAPKIKNEQKPFWISNPYSRQLTHKWRAREAAILVGTNTVLQDNPTLNTRDWHGTNPVRVIIDRSNKIDDSYSVLSNEFPTFILSDINTDPLNESKKNIENVNINWDQNSNIAKQICDKLFDKGIISVIIEGGSKTLQTFIDENLWDEARVFTSDLTLDKGVEAPQLNKPSYMEKSILNDRLNYYKNHQY